MKRFGGFTIFPLLLCACLWFMACLPQSVAAAETPPQPGDSPSPIPSAAEMEKALTEWIKVEQYDLDLRTEAEGGTRSFSREEVQQAKDLVRARLSAEGIDKYEPSVRLVDVPPGTMMPIFIGVFDKRELPNGEQLRREYHIRNGKLFRILKRYANRKTSIQIATGAKPGGDEQCKLGADSYPARQVDQAQAVIADYVRDKYGWRAEQYDIIINSAFLNDYRQKNQLPPPIAQFLLSWHKDPEERPTPGGGNELLFEIDMESMKIVKEWGFQ